MTQFCALKTYKTTKICSKSNPKQSHSTKQVDTELVFDKLTAETKKEKKINKKTDLAHIETDNT